MLLARAGGLSGRGAEQINHAERFFLGLGGLTYKPTTYALR